MLGTPKNKVFAPKNILDPKITTINKNPVIEPIIIKIHWLVNAWKKKDISPKMSTITNMYPLSPLNVDRPIV